MHTCVLKYVYTYVALLHVSAVRGTKYKRKCLYSVVYLTTVSLGS
jgi:hypothetical protein